MGDPESPRARYFDIVVRGAGTARELGHRIGRAFVNESADGSPDSVTLRFDSLPFDRELHLVPPAGQRPLDGAAAWDVLAGKPLGDGGMYWHRVGSASYAPPQGEVAERFGVSLESLPLSHVVRLYVKRSGGAPTAGART
jgi:hypothetical protein